jgi:predicted dehydrogenase
MDIVASPWRNQGYGVIDDLLPHCLQIMFELFPKPELQFHSITVGNSETICPDFASCLLKFGNQYVRIKNSYLSWKNTFLLRLMFEKGFIALDALTKWSDAKLTWGIRTLPSGLPKMQELVFPKGDSTIKSELDFLHSYNNAKMSRDAERNKYISGILGKIHFGRN